MGEFGQVPLRQGVLAIVSYMPEGDTIFRTAQRLRPVLVGQSLRRFDAPRLVGGFPPVGTSIEAVRSEGKYLLVDFSDGSVLETHMKMTGSWHIYKVGERWQKPTSSARVTLEVENGWVAVCFSAPHVRVMAAGSRRSQDDRLGPDLAADEFDLPQALERFYQFGDPDAALAVVLLDQRIFCGVGNVYKSELLFARGLHPELPCRLVEPSEVEELFVLARRLVFDNSRRPGPRVTMAKGLAVYGRSGKRCWSCSDQIRSQVHGEHARRTYWCPTCQPVGGHL